MARGYSHIVIGAGAIGSAAAYWLAQAGVERVLVLEQFDLVNTLGSSGDHSRIIRRAYHRPEYTRLTDAMYAAWAHVEEQSGLTLFTRTGGIDLAAAGSAGEDEVDEYRRAMDAASIPYEDLSIDDIRERYPQWHVPDDTIGLFQQDGGILDIRRSVSVHTALALAAGAEFRPRTKVTGVAVHERGVTVSTADGPIDADHLVVAAASWLGDLMPDLGLNFSLTLSQEQVAYFVPERPRDFAPERFPIWIHHADEVHYGFPVYGEAAVKIARDMRGHYISSGERVFDGDAGEHVRLRRFLAEFLPAAAGPLLSTKTCVYDMPPDRDFVLDIVPGRPHVAVFNGAGHAGKFAGLVGRIIADLLTVGSTPHELSAFSLTRPAIIDPDFVPRFRLRSAVGDDR
ncbi:sarcosine oxidase [Microbacterium terrae]|uniref:Monomeric sarcosine oxidase n=1 Tax=Microbacterium terrae TaxID=69369 RepID=A0A0M2HHW9_9MICO|nr:N-methyl-L-tryptophan oxidase [Microbacterium terrae]KJL43921.1 Monomeric sarcosine oxidase [Microbacterium terrae]MBP1078670.1 sarcosine oxidase [Microbacterium terrae]GLJ98071.1 N-methyltryptophan oxidase [Microbacterium terrae]